MGKGIFYIPLEKEKVVREDGIQRMTFVLYESSFSGKFEISSNIGEIARVKKLSFEKKK